MNNKEICEFINSKDVRRHLLNTNYTFTTSEAAWLVFKCKNISLQEKFTAWEDIICTMPDDSLDPRFFDKTESIHNILKKYISVKKRFLEMFFDSSNNDIFYQFSIHQIDDLFRTPCYSKNVSSYDECYSNLVKTIERFDKNKINCCSMTRSIINSNAIINVDYTRQLEIKCINIYKFDELGDFDFRVERYFDDITFDFPTSFKEGDILYLPFSPFHFEVAKNEPIVMERYNKRYYDICEAGTALEDFNMSLSGYVQNEHAEIIYTNGLIGSTGNYMDYEYFPNEHLTGKRRILTAISNYIRGKIPLDLLLFAYSSIIQEYNTEEHHTKASYCYTEKGFSLAGLTNHYSII